jgi:hypothetical protein
MYNNAFAVIVGGVKLLVIRAKLLVAACQHYGYYTQYVLGGKGKTVYLLLRVPKPS